MRGRRRTERHEPGMVTVETAIAQGPLWMGLILALVPLMMMVELMGVNHMARDVARELAIHGTSGSVPAIEQAQGAGAQVSVSVDGDYVEVSVTKPSPRLMDLMGVELTGTHRVMVEPHG